MDVVYGIIPAEELQIGEKELARRLGVGSGTDAEALEALTASCRERLMKVLECRYAWIRLPLDLSAEGVCQIGPIRVESRDLYKNLKGCREAVLMGVTLGIGVDRLLMRLDRISRAEHFITDAAASAAAEALCNETDQRIRETLEEEARSEGEKGLRFHPRYSPGYGDCSIRVQEPLLQQLRSQTTLGITLNEACLMTPVKSITAIMGIEE